MQTSSMRTDLKTEPGRRAEQGFTLMELLIVLLLVSTLTGIGAGLFSLERNALHEGARQVETAVSMARNSAMLRNRPVYLELKRESLEIRETEKPSPKGMDPGNGETFHVQELPSGVSVAGVNERLLTDSADTLLCFRSLGVASERVIWLSDGPRSISIYIPAVGKPLTLEGRATLEQMRKEYL